MTNNIIEREPVRGLVDKNGKQVFVGDIIKKGFEHYVVKYDEEQLSYEFYTPNGCKMAGCTSLASPFIEIVGNVNDNPDMLSNVKM